MRGTVGRPRRASCNTRIAESRQAWYAGPACCARLHFAGSRAVARAPCSSRLNPEPEQKQSMRQGQHMHAVLALIIVASLGGCNATPCILPPQKSAGTVSGCACASDCGRSHRTLSHCAAPTRSVTHTHTHARARAHTHTQVPASKTDTRTTGATPRVRAARGPGLARHTPTRVNTVPTRPLRAGLPLKSWRFSGDSRPSVCAPQNGPPWPTSSWSR